MNRPYENIPDPPEAYDGHGVLVRLIDGLGFRFRWATEGLTDGDFDFRPADGTMSVGQLIDHIFALVRLVAETLEAGLSKDKAPSPEQNVEQVLATLERMRTFLTERRPGFSGLSIRNQPFWCAINGPLADALTHVGQIAMARRLNGNPVPKTNPFTGRSAAEI